MTSAKKRLSCDVWMRLRAGRHVVDDEIRADHRSVGVMQLRVNVAEQGVDSDVLAVVADAGRGIGDAA